MTADPRTPSRTEPENPWRDRLVKAERENHCGDAACMTRRVAAAIRVLAGGKEHQDYCWAIEAFEAELGVRDPRLVGPEPSSATLDAPRLSPVPAPRGLKALRDIHHAWAGHFDGGAPFDDGFTDCLKRGQCAAIAALASSADAGGTE